ncbi:MAG: Rrf2 family transcriptional regulator [Thermodesulfobacteriota bacterium]
MKISTKSRYGTRLLLDLASREEQGFIQLADIAQRLSVSMKYLEQIILPLKRAGYVQSARGAKGGHRLALEPSEIRIGDVVALLEGGREIIACALDPATCDRSAGCRARQLWKKASEGFFNTLNQVTVADLLRDGELCI